MQTWAFDLSGWFGWKPTQCCSLETYTQASLRRNTAAAQPSEWFIFQNPFNSNNATMSWSFFPAKTHARRQPVWMRDYGQVQWAEWKIIKICSELNAHVWRCPRTFWTLLKVIKTAPWMETKVDPVWKPVLLINLCIPVSLPLSLTHTRTHCLFLGHEEVPTGCNYSTSPLLSLKM